MRRNELEVSVCWRESEGIVMQSWIHCPRAEAREEMYFLSPLLVLPPSPLPCFSDLDSWVESCQYRAGWWDVAVDYVVCIKNKPSGRSSCIRQRQWNG